MNERELQGVQLLKRPAPDKLVFTHYAVGVGSQLAWQEWRVTGSLIFELKPDGIRSEWFDRSLGWSAVATARDEATALARLRDLLASSAPYDAVFNNCEHTARHVVTGAKESTQVQVGVLIAGGIALGTFLFARTDARTA